VSSTFALTLSYKGANYSGFARQKDPVIRTVQETLECALTTVLRTDDPVLTTCAGRTDAGVHARAQVVSFNLPSELAGELSQPEELCKLMRSLNALTPSDISILDLRPVPLGFSARFDALSRTYHYRIYNAAQRPIFCADFAWHYPQKLNIPAMRTATIHLLGAHNFRSFCTAASAPADKNMIREIMHINISTENVFGEELVLIEVKGNAFLHSMVRILAGTLVQVGAGKSSPDDIPHILDAQDRSAAGQTAPAHGLTLYSVAYSSYSIP
jgi:tRNA pseudouridine38-40 synthase